MEYVLATDGISFGYKGTPILKGVSIGVRKGEFLGILGANGAGKSTLLRLMRGLLNPSEGYVSYKGRPLSFWSLKELAIEMALVPQWVELFIPITARDIVFLGRTPHIKGWFEGKADVDAVERAMRMTDIYNLSHREFHTLSGGEKRRVILAKALAQEPKILLLDEPTDDLDLMHQGEFMSLLGKFKEDGQTIAITSHNINILSEYCDRLILIKDSGVYASGVPGEVLTQGILKKVFGWDVSVDSNPLSGKPRVTPVYK